MYFDSNSSSSDTRYFNWLVMVAQVFGLLAVVLVAVWMGHYQGGFAWQSDPNLQFNFHPLFMIIGMIFLYGDGILTYRVFRNDKKLIVKIVHALMHVAALVFAAVGLKAVFDNHNLSNPPKDNLRSLHSWLGLFVVVAFGLQWLLGFMAFLTPALGLAVKRFYMPYHRFWGAALLGLAGTTAVMGITEALVFKVSPAFAPPQGLLANFLGIFIIAFVVFVIYLVTKPEYQRPPAPEEDHIQLAD